MLATFIGVGALGGLILTTLNNSSTQKSLRDKDSRRSSLKQVRLKRTKTLISQEDKNKKVDDNDDILDDEEKEEQMS